MAASNWGSSMSSWPATSDRRHKAPRQGSSARCRDRSEGFTLVELIVVVVVIGILSSIAFFAVRGVREQSVVTACQSNAVQMLKALEAYKIRTGAYPNGKVAGDELTSADIDVLVTAGYIRSNYMSKSPDYQLMATLGTGGSRVVGTFTDPAVTKPCQAP